MTHGDRPYEPPPVPPADWRERSFESWRGRKAVLASRHETSGPRVDECTVAMSYHRLRAFLVDELRYSPGEADALIDGMLRVPGVAAGETESAGSGVSVS